MAAQRIEVDSVGLTTAGAQAQAVGATPVGGVPPLLPPGADTQSVQAVGAVAARGAKLLAYLNTAAGHAQAGGAQLASDAITFEATDAENAAWIIASGTNSAGPSAGAAPASAAPAAPSIPTYVDASPLPDSTSTPAAPTDPELFATELHHGGDRGASLQQWASYWTAAGAEADRRATTLRALAATISGGAWTRDGAGAPPATAFEQLAVWHESAATGCRDVSSAATAAHSSWTSATANTPTPSEFEQTRLQLEQANAANVASGGRYTPVVSQLQTRLATLRGDATTSNVNYSATPAPLFTPVATPPKVIDGNGSGSEQGDGQGNKPTDGKDTGDGKGADDTNEYTDDGATATAEPTGTPTTADKTQTGENSDASSTAQSLAQALPSLLSGVLGAAVSIPAAAAQQIASTGGQVVQGLAGAAQSFTPASDEADDGSLGDDSLGDAGGGDLGDLGGADDGGGGGGGGDVTTEPAATTLGTNAAVAPPSAAAAPTGVSAIPTSAAPASGGRMMGGMPMMPMSQMAGAGAPGGGDARGANDNGKKAVLRPRPNTERIHAPVDRELAQRQHTTAAAAAEKPDAPLGRPRPKPTPRRGPAKGEEEQ